MVVKISLPIMNKEFYFSTINCRVCSSELNNVIELEPQFLSPTFVQSNYKNNLSEIKVPLTLCICTNKECSLVQLRETTNPDLLYKDYFYRSATNSTMLKDLKKVVDKAQAFVPLSTNEIVVDIGANDCSMLSYFPKDLKRIAVEPATNIDWSDVDKTIEIINDFFPSEKFSQNLGNRKVKIFTSCAMFYDLNNPNLFVQSIKENLDDDGVWCIQLSYLISMLKNINFYDICHEHLEYYSLQSLNYLLNKHDLDIVHAETNDVNGGSVIVFIKHKKKNNHKSKELLELILLEEKMNLSSPETYKNFFVEMCSLGKKVSEYIKNEIKNNRLVIGLGASTKGNVLLQFFGIDKKMLPYISEKQNMKVGLKTLGSDIELISEEKARDLNPSCMLLLPWYFKKEILLREKDYLDKGGSILIPMPYLHVIDKNGEKKL